MSLSQQMTGLNKVISVGENLLAPDVLAQAQELADRTAQRRSLSPSHTVIGLFGATGSGKSSVFNALVEDNVTRTGLIRPTTNTATAAVWGGKDAFPLLEWLQVSDVWLSPEAGSHGRKESDFDGTQAILLDLPDFDSVSDANREIVDRLTQQVDVLVWLMDPQKYADRVIHDDYIRPLSHHASVTVAVLNQVDRLDQDERLQVQTSAKELLEHDDLADVPLFLVSAKTGEGIAELRQALSQIAHGRTAKDQRLSNGISAWAQGVQTRYPVQGRRQQGQEQEPVQALTSAAASAARVDLVAHAVGDAYKKRAAQKTGWFATSWIHSFRSDPLRRLHLHGSKPSAPTHSTKSIAVSATTSLPPLSGANAAALSLAIRDYKAALGRGLPDAWQQSIQRAGADAQEVLPLLLDQAVGQTDFKVRSSWWWTAVRGLQVFAFLFALVGLGWYVAAWISAAFGLPLVTITKFEGWPVPGILLAFGVLLGLILGAVFAAIGSTVAKRRERMAQKALTQNVSAVMQREVVDPTRAVLAHIDELQQAIAEAAGTTP